MEGQQEPKKGHGALSMGEIGQALPQVSSNPPTSSPASYPSNFPQYQYQTSSPPSGYPAGQYQQPYTGGQSPTAYGVGQSETPYYSFTLGQHQSDPSQLQLQYGGQVGYRSPVASPVNLPQYSSGIQRPMQQASPQAYDISRYQYQQQYPQALSARAMSIPITYAASPPSRSPQQFALPPQYLYPPSYLSTNASPLVSDKASTDPDRLLPRGPPRKPRQSGFALWVGNLPRDVLLEELKEFFALDGLESIFLIRKSNCAFVNYKTEEACSLALSMFNDKMFKNVRLVCRLRKSSPARTPTAISSASSSAVSSSQTLVSDVTPTKSITPLPEKTMEGGEQKSAIDTPLSASTPVQTPLNRYFIMKSLTKEDLAWSVSNKVWATQPHNESMLNDAFRNSENVYLIFSVNKSGEFFGYARMISDINDRSSSDAVKHLEPRTEVQVSDPPVVIAGPKTTITPKTDSVPRGKIFEDEVRGTVFWEVAESSDEEEGDGEEVKPDERWGNPFRIEWLKWGNPLQFQRTRLLRNPWNGNREVKISRDGTELETSVGVRLLKEFDAESSNIPFGANTQSQSQRRMSYPMASFRPIPPAQLLYQQVPQMQPQMQPQGVTYVPYTTLQASQPVIYGYGQSQGQGRGSPQQPYGGSGQQYYGQPPQQ